MRVALGSACPQREAELRAREVAADEADGHVVSGERTHEHGRHRRGRARGQRRLATALTPGSPRPAVRLSPAWPPGCRAARPPRLRRPPRRVRSTCCIRCGSSPSSSAAITTDGACCDRSARSSWPSASVTATACVERRRPSPALADDAASMISGTRASTEAPTIRATDSPRGRARACPAVASASRRVRIRLRFSSSVGNLRDEGAEVLLPQLEQVRVATAAFAVAERGSPVISDPVPTTSPGRSFPTRRPSSKIDRVRTSGISASERSRCDEAVDDHEHALALLALAADELAGLERPEAHDRGHALELRRVEPLEQLRPLERGDGHRDPLERHRPVQVAPLHPRRCLARSAQDERAVEAAVATRGDEHGVEVGLLARSR